MSLPRPVLVATIRSIHATSPACHARYTVQETQFPRRYLKRDGSRFIVASAAPRSVHTVESASRTIKKRNSRIRAVAGRLAESDGREAKAAHWAEVADCPDGVHYTRCCERAYEEGARNTYAHLTRRRTYVTAGGRSILAPGLPALQRMLGGLS